MQLNLAAIQLQIQDEITHSVANVLPALHGILNTVKDSESGLTEAPPLREFIDLLEPLKVAMERCLSIAPESNQGSRTIGGYKML